MYIYIYVYMCTQTLMYIYIHINIDTFICMYMYVCIHMYVVKTSLQTVHGVLQFPECRCVAVYLVCLFSRHTRMCSCSTQ